MRARCVKGQAKQLEDLETRTNDHTQAVTPEGIPGPTGYRATEGWKAPSLVTVNQWVQPVAGLNRTRALTTTCAQGATGGGGGGAAAGMVETGSAGLGVLTRRRRRRPPRCPGRRRDGEEGLEAGTSVWRAAVAADELLTLLCVLMFLTVVLISHPP